MQKQFIKIIRETIILVVVGGVIGVILNAFSDSPLPWIRPPKVLSEWPTLTAEEVMRRIEEGSAIVIDARPVKYFNEGHIPSAINLPAPEFGQAFETMGDALPRDFPLIVYCHGGTCDESYTVLDHLKLLEFQELYLYEEGFMDWQQKEYPIEIPEE